MPREHPFDSIPVDADGRGVPDVEPEDAEVLRASWRAMNAVVVPRIR